MKRCLIICRGCYWFGNFEEELASTESYGVAKKDYTCIGTDDTWYSKKDYKELEVPDDCPCQDLHEALQDEKPIV
jgi:hypothetical protein